jgi:methanogenic corrinoid protein MtbC1
VVGAVSGELHTLATSMAAIALREDGWSVHHLGAGVPAEDFLQFAREVEADLVVLTVTFARVRPLATSIARDLGAEGIRALIGGPGESLEELRQQARDT